MEFGIKSFEDWTIILLGALWVFWIAAAITRAIFTDKYPLWPLDKRDLAFLDNIGKHRWRIWYEVSYRYYSTLTQSWGEKVESSNMSVYCRKKKIEESVRKLLEKDLANSLSTDRDVIVHTVRIKEKKKIGAN